MAELLSSATLKCLVSEATGFGDGVLVWRSSADAAAAGEAEPEHC